MTDKEKEIVWKARCIKELERIQKARLPRSGSINIMGGGVSKHINYSFGVSEPLESLANNIFRPKLQQALEEYKEKLREEINK